ncbi:Transmembrane protein 163 [Labeo rohita]|uniref:Transmembrane protein 163 n=1 Tax=Labeo rohita TaxID=84645 RepID=A0ABQ8LLJ9_LABRO|nr:Transmembrane protein 163 [Labeo rohita]
MTDPSSAADPTAGPVDPGPASVPDPAVLDSASTPANGHHPNQADMEQQMKIGEPEDNGLLESSMRLKPHEAQSYRKKALWVSWVSIGITTILAIAAFSEYPDPRL